jgi:hypothetical protein
MQERGEERIFDSEYIAKFRTKDADLNEELHRDYSVRQSDWHQHRSNDNYFVHNAQFSEDQEEELTRRGQAAIPINVLYPAVEQAVAMLTTNKPRYQTTAREDSDRDTAKVYTDLLSYIHEISDGNTRLKTTTYDYYIKGRGVWQVYVDSNSDYGRGDVKIIDLDPFEVFPDPASRDRLWRDSAHILTARFLSREQIQAMWPDAEDMGITIFAGTAYGETDEDGDALVAMSVAQGQEFGPQEVETDSEMIKVIERYSRVKQRHYHVFDSTVREERAFTKEEMKKYVDEPAFHIFQEGQPEQFFTEGPEFDQAWEMFQQAQPSSVGANTRTVQLPPIQDPETGEVIEQEPVVLTLITVGDLISDGLITVREVLLDRIKLVITIGGYEYYNSVLPISHYPIVPLSNRHDRNPYTMSDVAFVRPIQQAINKLNMQILANLASNNNNKLIVPRGSINREEVERKLAMTGPAAIEVDYELGEPKNLGAGAFPNGLFAYFNTLTEMAEREFGIFSVMMGDASKAPDTYKGTLALDDFGQRRIRSKLDDIESFLQQIARVCVEFIPKVYTEQKIVRLVQPNGTIRESIANHVQYDDLRVGIGRINDVTVGTYDVSVVAGSTLPSNRWAMMEYLTEMYKNNLVDQVEVLKKSDVVDMEGVLERMSYIKQLEGMIEQLQEENKKLEGQVQSAVTNELTAKKQAIVEKFKGGVQATKADVDAKAMLMGARMTDAVQQARASQMQAETE